MSEDDNTKELSDRELLILLHGVVSELNGRVGRLEEKSYSTHTLPVNFEARFTALEERVGRIESNLLEFKVETRANFRALREDRLQEQQMRAQLEDRITLLESRPS